MDTKAREGARALVEGTTAEEARLREVPPPGELEPDLHPAGEADLPAHGSLQVRLKRAFDIVGALLGLILLAPLILLIALMIKLDSPGPVFFSQRRIGRFGVPFAMRKFRTMIVDADAHKLALLHLNDAGDGLFKISQDPRVTRFGRFLRSTSLDELPQLIHVLSGTMSLVGPRPLIPDEDEQIGAPYRRRLLMRPGITGAWQVAGASRIPISEMVKLDDDYVASWSLHHDLKLLIGTVPHVLLRRGI
jgi:lipopolysaccharide/colanic/teichoic acid biosynthesis glycosyltransferase